MLQALRDVIIECAENAGMGSREKKQCCSNLPHDYHALCKGVIMVSECAGHAWGGEGRVRAEGGSPGSITDCWEDTDQIDIDAIAAGSHRQQKPDKAHP
eukprot:751433-Hanusia_phi.AAC.3